jgi:NADH dehydrogenase FAD-containing subunit
MRSAAATVARRPRIVVVGGGFAGHQAARTLSRRLGQSAEIVVVNPTDHFLYLPLLPEVAAGTLEPRRIAVSLAATLPGVRLVLGKVDTVDVRNRHVTWVDPEGGRGGTVHSPLRGQRMRWILLDSSLRVLPQLDERLSRTAHRVLEERGVEVRVGQSVTEADDTDHRRTDRHPDPRVVRRCPARPAGR